jgi:AAA family ATP:ADP antiporter
MLERIVDLRRGEGALVVRAFAALFALIAGHTVLETARDALFLERLPASRLALVYFALALIGIVLPLYNTRFVRSFGRRNAIVFTSMVAAVGTTVWHFQPMNERTVYGLYLWSGLIGTVLAVQFWMFAGQMFTVAQGKRLFPGIASGGILGAVAGGAVAAGMLELGRRYGGIGVPSLLLLGAGFFMVAAAILTSVATDDVGTPFRTTRPDATLASGLEVLRDHPYVRRIATFVAISTLAVLATDYLFKFVAKQHLGAEELGPFFARYYTGLNAVALVVQLFVARRLMARIGVVASLAILPALLLGGAAGIVMFGGVWVMVLIAKGADGSLRHSLHRVASELLLLPLPSEVRDRAKSLLDAVFVRGAQAAGAGGILLLAATGVESARVLAWVVAGLATGWLVIAVTIRRGYVDVLRRGVRRGTLDARALRSQDLDIDSVESVMNALSSSDARKVSAAMDLLVDSNRARLIPALILYHRDEELVLKGLDIISRIDEQDWRPHAVRLAKSPSVRLRTAALRALGRACEADLVREALDDPSPEVRAHAAFQLARCEGADEPTEHPAIKKLLADAAEASAEDRVAMRLGLLNALREDADERWVEVLLGVAESDRSPKVVDAVAHAVMRVPDPRFVHVLVRALDLRDARGPVRDALVRIGSPALDALSRALDDPTTSLAVRRQIPIAIAGFGSQRAADLLTERLKVETDGLLRYRVLRGLSRLVSEHAVKIDGALIEAELERNLLEHFRLMSLLVPIEETEDVPEGARGSDMLLTGLLRDKMRQAEERAFRLFKIMHPREDIRSIFLALSAQQPGVRAHAQEFLDALAVDCAERCRTLFRIVADDLPMSAKVARAEPFLGEVARTRVEALRALLADEDDSVVSLATYHATALGVDEVGDEVASVVTDRPSLRAAAELGAAEATVRATSADLAPTTLDEAADG